MNIEEEINDKFSDLMESGGKLEKPLPEISEDDEVYILQVPRSIDIKQFKGANFKISKNNCQISKDVFSHNCILHYEKKILHIADTGKVRKLKIKGQIRVKAAKDNT